MVTALKLEEQSPWKQRFRALSVANSQIAKANPQRGLAVSDESGKHQLYAWDVPSGSLRRLTDRPTGISSGALSGDGRHVYYFDDRQGDEIGHFVRIPYAGGDVQDLTPDLRPYSTFTFASSGSGGHFGFMTATPEGNQIYSLETPATDQLGTRRLLFHSKKVAFGPTYSFLGDVAIVAATEHTTSKHYNLLAFDTASGAWIAELWDGPGTSAEPLGFPPLPGDCRLAGTTNRGGLRRPFIWNPRTGDRSDLELPELSGEVIPLDWSPDGKCLLLCQFSQAVQQLYLYDLVTRTPAKLNHPGGTFGSVFFGPTGEILAHWQDAAHPARLIALDGLTGEWQRTVLAAGEAPAGHPWKSITFPSSDGQMIQGWLGLPDGKGPFPTILHTHGGPEAVMTESFSPGLQCWLDHGFATLTINYRGSVTFGREFQEKIWGNIGYWEMEDLAAARHWLVKEGISLPDAIFLTGKSYGGYITLMGVGKWPELWAGGMAGIAIADWTMLYEDSADSLKGYQVALFGGTPLEKPQQYRASSPVTYAEAVKAPVLIIQGRNDTRTPARPIQVYEQKLKDLGKPVEVHWFDAGHKGAGVEQDILNHEIMLRFAHRVLATRNRPNSP